MASSPWGVVGCGLGGTRGPIRTDTSQDLNLTPLPLGYASKVPGRRIELPHLSATDERIRESARKSCLPVSPPGGARRGSRTRTCAGLKSAASAIGLRERIVHEAGFEPAWLLTASTSSWCVCHSATRACNLQPSCARPESNWPLPHIRRRQATGPTCAHRSLDLGNGTPRGTRTLMVLPPLRSERSASAFRHRSMVGTAREERHASPHARGQRSIGRPLATAQA